MEVKIITDVGHGQELWKMFSDDKTIFCHWDFRYAFYKYFNYPLKFITIFQSGEPLALLPLQMNLDKGYLEFFGGEYMEDNRIFVKDGYEHLKEEALIFLSGNYYKLDAIIEDQPNKYQMDFYDNKFTLSLGNYNSTNDFLVDKWSSKSRNTLKRKINKVDMLGCEIIENYYEDINLLFSLNKQTFGLESGFHQPFREQTFRNLLDLYRDSIQMLTFIIGGKKLAVSLAVKYHRIYEYINAGTESGQIPNLGSYVIYKNIEKAISLRMSVFDGFTENCGWKERWHLKKSAQYKLTNFDFNRPVNLREAD